MFVCMCVCVREREIEKGSYFWTLGFFFFFLFWWRVGLCVVFSSFYRVLQFFYKCTKECQLGDKKLKIPFKKPN